MVAHQLRSRIATSICRVMVTRAASQQMSNQPYDVEFRMRAEQQLALHGRHYAH